MMTYDMFVVAVIVLSIIGLGLATCLLAAFNQIRMLRNNTNVAIELLGRRIDLNAFAIEERYRLAKKQAEVDIDNALKAIAPIIDEKHEICREAIRAMSNRQDSFETIQKLQTKDLGTLFNKTRNLKAVKVRK